MTQIPWSTTPEPTIERMMAVLLSHIHNGSAARIDGKGGDGGRDVQIQTPEGILAFEIKSFTGRMTSGRRSQVQASLMRAANLAPIEWTMLVPIDHTPGELDWFSWLAGTVSFPIHWRGLTWLDGEFAQRPSIARYFLEDRRDELIELARLLDQEQAILTNGVSDVADRLRSLIDRANDLDPFYRFDRVVQEGNATSFRMAPRYPGAARDRPITAGFSVEFPEDEAGRKAAREFRRAVDFGTRFKVPPQYLKDATLDAPPSLGRDFKPSGVELLPSRPSRKRQPLILAVLDPGERSLAEVPVSFQIRSQGERGSILRGSDQTGTMTVEIAIDVPERTFNISIKIRGVPFLPAEMRPLARLLADLRAPNSLAVVAPDGERIGASRVDIDQPLGDAQFPRMVEDLALLQWAAGMTRKVGPEFTYDDAEALLKATNLLKGEALPITWGQVTCDINDNASEEFRRQILVNQTTLRLEGSQPYAARVGGVVYPIGRGTLVELLSGTLEPGHDDWRAAGIVPVAATITLVPGTTNKGLMRLVA